MAGSEGEEVEGHRGVDVRTYTCKKTSRRNDVVLVAVVAPVILSAGWYVTKKKEKKKPEREREREICTRSASYPKDSELTFNCFLLLPSSLFLYRHIPNKKANRWAEGVRVLGPSRLCCLCSHSLASVLACKRLLLGSA